LTEDEIEQSVSTIDIDACEILKRRQFAPRPFVSADSSPFLKGAQIFLHFMLHEHFSQMADPLTLLPFAISFHTRARARM
jgi:hypothetical protein